MRCEKCGYENSEYDIICEKCGFPLSIENNIDLKNKYNNKPKAIDIEEITPDHSEAIFNNLKQKVRYVVVFILGGLFATLVLYVIALIKYTKDNDIMTKYKKLMNNDGLGLIYIGEDKDVDKLINKYSNNYEFEYLYINTDKISKLKVNKIKSKLKLQKIDSTLVIVDSGKIIDTMDKANTDNDDIEVFLKKNNVIPKILTETDKYIKKFEDALKSEEPMILYIANNDNESNQKHNELLESFCDNYDINYTFVEGYYLNNKQKIKLLSKVNYNEIHDELLIIVDEGEVKTVTEFVSNEKKDYFDLASTYGIIDVSSAKNLKQINEKTLKNILDSKEKSIILFTSDDCVYCEKIKPILGKISIINNITIYTYNVDNLNTLGELLTKYGYSDTISTPSVIIVDNSKVIDIIIGLSDKKIYEEKFKEQGIIR